ncbi:MAG TPA: hypothetical protein GX740_01025, partial [Acholeplasmataceae bacterium]|nr:hypothetical protein [Acholeplasmataceae bacterium]
SHKIDCCLYVTINKYNENEIDDIIYNCKKYNIPVHFNYLTYSGRAKTNKNDLMPTSNDLLKKIKNAYEKYYSNKIIKLPNSCWADASVLQLDSEGNIYYCTEINHYNNKNWLGNIKTFPINEWLNRNKSVSYENKLNKCPYDVYYGENIFITKNINKKCDFCYNNKKISTIKQLNKVFDDLYQEFEMNCNGCEYPDCMGYIWLTKQETKKLSNLGVDILTINEDINCINSLGDISVDTDFSSIVYPKCPLRCDKSYKCKIHDERPMVCHIYPVGLESAKNGSILWVLHKDCLFVKQLENKGLLELFMLKCNQLINSLSIELEETIISTFKKIDNVSSFPNGENRYYILKERRELYVKV